MKRRSYIETGVGLLSGTGLVIVLCYLQALTWPMALVAQATLMLSNALVLHQGSQHWDRLTRRWQERNARSRARRHAREETQKHAVLVAVLQQRATLERSWIVEFLCAPTEYLPERWLLHGDHQRGMRPAPVDLSTALELAHEAHIAWTNAISRERTMVWRVRNALTGQAVLC